MKPLLVLGLLAAAAFALPSASASHEPCTSGVPELCEPLEDAGIYRLLGPYTDIIAAFVALFVVALLFVVLIGLFGKAGRGPKISAEVRQQANEVAPGGTIQLLADVENLRHSTSTDLVLEWDELPSGWSAMAFAAVPLPSGFSVPQAVSVDTPVHLTSPARGAHKAALALQVTAPPEVLHDENLEVTLRAVPVTGGVPRRGRSKKLRYGILLTQKRAMVQIQNVVHEPESIAAGRPVVTRAILANKGQAEARELGVSFLLNDQPVDQKIVPALPPSQETTVEFQWTPTLGENRIRIHLV